VVSVVGKGGGTLRQVCLKETNESEPLMTCRKAQGDVETGIETWIPRARVGEVPADCPTGVKGLSTDAEHRGGDARIREEGPVMGLDRRGVVIRLYPVNNPNGEDSRE
jgi:hypothetical protein